MRKAQDIETHGVSGHKQAKAVLKDIGQGMKLVHNLVILQLSHIPGPQVSP